MQGTIRARTRTPTEAPQGLRNQTREDPGGTGHVKPREKENSKRAGQNQQNANSSRVRLTRKDLKIYEEKYQSEEKDLKLFQQDLSDKTDKRKISKAKLKIEEAALKRESQELAETEKEKKNVEKMVSEAVNGNNKLQTDFNGEKANKRDKNSKFLEKDKDVTRQNELFISLQRQTEKKKREIKINQQKYKKVNSEG